MTEIALVTLRLVTKDFPDGFDVIYRNGLSPAPGIWVEQ